MRKQFYQITAQIIREPVDLHLVFRDLLLSRSVVFFQLFLGFSEIFPRDPEHRQQNVVAALKRQGRRSEKHRVQRLDQFPVRICFLFLLSCDPVAHFLINPEHRQKADRAYQIEHRIGICDHT